MIPEAESWSVAQGCVYALPLQIAPRGGANQAICQPPPVVTKKAAGGVNPPPEGTSKALGGAGPPPPLVTSVVAAGGRRARFDRFGGDLGKNYAK